MNETTWDRLASGIGCPMDAPRPDATEHWDLVTVLPVSSLYLAANQTYPGHCQLVYDRRHAARPDQLSAEEWRDYCDDLYLAQRAIVATVRPDHLNVETLGNVVPHLHWHIIPRYRSDSRWGSPIWLSSLGDMIETRLKPAERDDLIARLRTAVAAERTAMGDRP